MRFITQVSAATNMINHGYPIYHIIPSLWEKFEGGALGTVGKQDKLHPIDVTKSRSTYVTFITRQVLGPFGAVWIQEGETTLCG